MPLRTLDAADDALTIEWTLDADTARVWKCLTTAEVISQWLGVPLVADFAVGGDVVIEHGPGIASRSVVRELIARERLAMTWEFPEEAPSLLAVELEPGGDGSLLRLRHEDLGTLADDYLPGWLTHLSYLEGAALGHPLPSGEFWNLHATFTVLARRSGRVAG